MITSLKIKNIALISSIQINFAEGLNVLSGETGSGKTVIISAINFALGAKVDKSYIRNGEERCEAEVVFNLDGNDAVKKVLDEYEIEYDDELLISRKYTIDGKSSVKVNGQTVTLQMLKNITGELCDVYGQSEHYSLLKESSQLAVLDEFIGEEIQDYKLKLKDLISSIKEKQEILNSLGGDEKERERRTDYLEYELNEIDSAELKVGEEEELQSKKKILQNAEKIGESVEYSYQSLSEENCTIDLLNLAIKKMDGISDLDNNYQELLERLKNVKAEVSDISSELESIRDSLDFDEGLLNAVENRLDTIKSLERKYGYNIEEVLKARDKIEEELNNLKNSKEISEKVTNEINDLKNKVNNIYSKMTKLRVNGEREFSKRLVDEISLLGMKNASFKMDITEIGGDILSSNGNNHVEFLFSANLGEPLKPMSKIISGGEMSRFMLSMKLVSSVLPKGSTYIFDEIDAGISGVVAEIVAEKFSKLSENMQVITISHLPQIVSFSDKSFLIHKVDEEGRSRTEIDSLDEDGKIEEICRIIGAGINSDTARNHAIELVKNAEKIKREGK